MGSGTALPLAAVAPCLAQGTCSINTCWMISEMRGAWGLGVGGRLGPPWLSSRPPEPLPLPRPPKQPLYLRGCFNPRLSQAPLSSEPWKSWRARGKLLCSLRTNNLVFKPTSREVCRGQREPTLPPHPVQTWCAHARTHVHKHTNIHTHTVIQIHAQSLLTVLVRYNLHTIKFVPLKHSIQWFLVYLHSCAIIIII